MNVPVPRIQGKSTPATVAIFAASAVIVGAIGSVEVVRAGLCPDPLPFERMVPVTITAEVFAYFAVMLLQLGRAVPVVRVFLASLLGMVLRLVMASVAAVVGHPEKTTSFLGAFAGYYAGDYFAAPLQVIVTTLFLWLIRGVFEAPSGTLLMPPADVPDMEPDRLRGFHHPPAGRRQELIEELMRDTPRAQPASEAAPPPTASAVDLPLAAEVAPPVAPVTLTPRESVVLALREEQEGAQLPADARVAEHRPEPSAPQFTLISEAIGAQTAHLGLGRPTTRTSAAGRSIVLAVEEAADLDDVIAASEDLVAAGTTLCARCGLGTFQKVLIRFESGYLGGAAILRQEGGLLVVLDLPPNANFGVASSALDKLAELTLSFELPRWPACEEPSILPGHSDEDLLGRVAPVLEWVPEAAGLGVAAASVSGRQVVLLAQGDPPSEATGAVVYAFDSADRQCAALGRPNLDLVLWSGDAGAVASSPATIAGQRLLLCLRELGGTASMRANMQLGQVLRGLARLDQGGPGGAI